ncbi:MAG TPA: NAD(P)-binding domain-containing protein [Polyangiaceae bacterium]|jgi:glycerol-3-phosphate dehydrogenase (NAD(P)+)
MSRPVVGVIGGGAWGVALAAAAARTGGTTLLLSRRTRGDALPEGVEAASDNADLAERARLILLAVPSGVARSVARAIGPHLDGRHFIVHGVRGLVRVGDDLDGSPPRPNPVTDDLETISDIVRDETPARRIGALGGPALASDLLAGRPSVMVCGSRYPEVTVALREAFVGPLLRLYATEDLLGLEWASALVGCLAIGVGYARGVGLGPGLLAAFITRAVEEAGRLTAAAGGDARTLLGLAGYGDLLATIAQPERPEVLVGEALAQGKSLEQALAETEQRVEAVELTGRLVAWAEARDVKAPVFGTLARSVLTGRTSDALVRELMCG